MGLEPSNRSPLMGQVRPSGRTRLLPLLVVLNGTIELVKGSAVFLEGTVTSVLEAAQGLVDSRQGFLLVSRRGCVAVGLACLLYTSPSPRD